MNKIDTEKIKRSHNIVDVIGRYVNIKKQGKDWFGCCPFHSEKSPSFTVEEGKQFYHCFGCGAHGDVIRFVQDYSGVEFMDACKELGAEIELMPAKKVQQNIKRASMTNNYPSYDKRDPEKCAEFVKGETLSESMSYTFFDMDLYPVIDFDGQMVNLYEPVDQGFMAGGVSHVAFTPIIKNSSKNYLVVVDFWDGIRISYEKNVNVMIVYSAYNMLLTCKTESEHKKIPVLRYEDTQAENLCDLSGWVYLDSEGKLHKKSKGEYLDD